MSNKIKVKLIGLTPNPLDVIYCAMRCCYSSLTPDKIWEEDITREKKIELVEKVIKSKHWSTIEHVSLTFAISGIDRNCSHQLVRKRIASYSQQSLRYVDICKSYTLEDLSQLDVKKGIEVASKFYTDVNENNWEYYISSLIHYIEAINNGSKKEEARNLLCSNIRTNIVMTLNLRSFLDLLGNRMCTRAQKPIRILANKMVEAVKEADNGELDFLYKYFAPKCVQNNRCEEEHGCGFYKG
jgi:thymidylate synthase (FAD)